MAFASSAYKHALTCLHQASNKQMRTANHMQVRFPFIIQQQSVQKRQNMSSQQAGSAKHHQSSMWQQHYTSLETRRTRCTLWGRPTICIWREATVRTSSCRSINQDSAAQEHRQFTACKTATRGEDFEEHSRLRHTEQLNNLGVKAKYLVRFTAAWVTHADARELFTAMALVQALMASLSTYMRSDHQALSITMLVC